MVIPLFLFRRFSIFLLLVVGSVSFSSSGASVIQEQPILDNNGGACLGGGGGGGGAGEVLEEEEEGSHKDEECRLEGEGEEADVAGVAAASEEETTGDNQATSPPTITRKNKETEDISEDIGVKQIFEVSNKESAVSSTDILRRIMEAREYVRNEVNDTQVRMACKNKHRECAAWAARGECDGNPSYMTTHCAPVCRTCDLLDIKNRCPIDPNEPDALQQPGDLNRVFERIVNDPWYQQYEPVVLSRPTYAPGDNANNATYKLGLWLIMLDKALTDEEADRMIELGGIMGYERSQGVGKIQFDGTWDEMISESRTSTNAWCNNECADDPIAKRLMGRVENITGIPEKNAESFQLLKYGPHEFYKQHNDFIEAQRKRPYGVRVLTLYFYLNDVEDGGGTSFPKLGMTVTPKKGRAVLWPSVYDGRPNTKDPRSDHEAMPVIKGEKYGCNAWVHQRDFKTPSEKGC